MVCLIFQYSSRNNPYQQVASYCIALIYAISYVSNLNYNYIASQFLYTQFNSEDFDMWLPTYWQT